jgi:hypothetical protein
MCGRVVLHRFSSSLGVIGERQPGNLANGRAAILFRMAAVAVLLARPNHLLHHPSSNKTHIEDWCQDLGCLEFGHVLCITILRLHDNQYPLHEPSEDLNTGDSIETG